MDLFLKTKSDVDYSWFIKVERLKLMQSLSFLTDLVAIY